MACGCHKENIACTSCCNCGGNENCNNPFTRKQALEAEELEQDTQENMDFEEGDNDEFEKEDIEMEYI